MISAKCQNVQPDSANSRHRNRNESDVVFLNLLMVKYTILFRNNRIARNQLNMMFSHSLEIFYILKLKSTTNREKDNECQHQHQPQHYA